MNLSYRSNDVVIYPSRKRLMIGAVIVRGLPGDHLVLFTAIQ